MSILKQTLILIFVLACATLPPAQAEPPRQGFEEVDGVQIFYREAGNPENPAIVLLHGFPSSSHQYRNLLRELSDDYYLIAPDYPGFGASAFPSPASYEYSFASFSETIGTLLEQKGIETYALYVHDYGAPVGMRIAMAAPEKVTAIITQNGNMYEEGLNAETWAPIMTLWENGRGNQTLETTIAQNVFSMDGLRWQYTHGTRNPDGILPDNWLLDYQSISRDGQHDVQLDLFFDYRNNVAQYPAWQAYLRTNQPPVLALWAKNDAFFPVSGTNGFRRDVKDLTLTYLDTGHFALEEDLDIIATQVRNFLSERVTE